MTDEERAKIIRDEDARLRRELELWKAAAIMGWMLIAYAVFVWLS